MGYYGWNPEILIQKIAPPPPQVVQSLEKYKEGVDNWFTKLAASVLGEE